MCKKLLALLGLKFKDLNALSVDVDYGEHGTVAFVQHNVSWKANAIRSLIIPCWNVPDGNNHIRQNLQRRGY